MGKACRCATMMFVAVTAIDGGTAPSWRSDAMATESNESGQAQVIAAQVNKAFDAARRGDFAPLTELQEVGPAIVPALALYLDDPDESIRREVVILLKVVGGTAALPLLERALNDASADIKERAATSLYERDDLSTMAARTTLRAALCKSVQHGNPSAAALLLLAYFPDKEVEKVLQAEQAQPAGETVELETAPTPVPRSLPATVALSRIGAPGARKDLLGIIHRGKLDELRFLLAILREIDAPEVLHELKSTLDDQRETGSGAPIGVEQRRRLCDDAVDAFVRRLTLRMDFDLSEARRYTQAEIGKVRDAINSSIPH
ncbi:HEAT repeat domain-containing protein [Singulisphaera sp. Ch08]|uniref:HEAT repeat domain-containing protein n=1 Tax=Singulisphaera sp. Ch08 TaxID=3120278 RepID=A0AAU7CE94_9BACT